MWLGHLFALALLAIDSVVRAWRIQLAVWTAGGRLGFKDAVTLNLYGEVASTLTPNRLGGEPARFLGLNEANVRPVRSIVAIGVEVATEWPVFLLVAGAMIAYYVPDWHVEARHWLRRHRAGELVAIEVIVLLILLLTYMLQRMARAGMFRHRVRRQWRVALAHVRRAPLWVLGVGAVLTMVSVAARAMILWALAWNMVGRPSFGEMFFGSLTLIHAPLVVPLPSGGGGIEVAFLSGFAGEFGDRQVTMLVLWRFYTTILLSLIGGYVLIRNVGIRAATKLFTIGWVGRSKERKP